MRVFFVFMEFGLAALNTALGISSLMKGHSVGAASIAVAVFCFGCGMFVLFNR